MKLKLIFVISVAIETFSFAAPVNQDCTGVAVNNEIDVACSLSKFLSKFGAVNPIKNSFRMKFLNLGYVPQGIHVEEPYYYVSLYHEQAKACKEDLTKCDDVPPSMVVKYNLNGKYMNHFFLEVPNLKTGKEAQAFSGHVGGLGMMDGFFVVPYEKTRRLAIFDPNAKTQKAILVAEIDLSSEVSREDMGRFAYLDIRKINSDEFLLMVGDADSKKNMEEKNKYSDRRYFYGVIIVKIKDKSKKIEWKVNSVNKFAYNKEILKINGVSPIQMSPNSMDLVIAVSYGPTKSGELMLMRCLKIVNIFECKDPQHLAIGPTGIEDVHVTKNSIWTLSESGSRVYSKWPENLPFVFEYDRKLLSGF